MKKILHISTECYPAAKAGGMGDVVGSLPLYLPHHNIIASVVIPKYDNKWFRSQSFQTIHDGEFEMGDEKIQYEVQYLPSQIMGFPFYCVDIPGKFDRDSIYLGIDGHGYSDEHERNISFQRAILEWLIAGKEKFDGVHCHDHMTGLIPFMMQQCVKYNELQGLPVFLTIHNGQYRGIIPWSKSNLLPEYDENYEGLLDWDNYINSLAAAIKCAWKINTVSPSYMQEVIEDSDVLTNLFQAESEKCMGILNGIDDNLWNPSKDNFLAHNLDKDDWNVFKRLNKAHLYNTYKLKKNRPLVGFIGRLAYQKGADILVRSIDQFLSKGERMNFIILGSGDKEIEHGLMELQSRHPGQVAVIIAYNEGLSREIYSGCDFLIMPSRFEPCGLNQLFSMRYGTIPIVSYVGGLKDTVPDIENNGNGIVMDEVAEKSIVKALERAITLYRSKSRLKKLIKKITTLDYSWNNSAKKYSEMYNEFLK